MKFIKTAFISLFVIIFSSGCLFVRGNTFKFDYNTGLVEITYHDFRSSKGYDDEDYSIEQDWKDLKDSLNETDYEEEQKVLKFTEAALFKEDEVLSGKVHFKVNCPSCFPSKISTTITILAGKGISSSQRPCG